MYGLPQALLINPWICDFSAYDLWASPLGLLSLASVLRSGGWQVRLLDCTDRWHPALAAGHPPRERAYHVGKYRAEEIPKPASLAWMPRRYKRYGLPLETFVEELEKGPAPDLILLSSRMTYWYPGVAEAAELCRRLFPQTPLLLGGVYATLCPEHAQAVCRPDRLVKGEGEPQLARLVSELGAKPLELSPELADARNLDALPFPAYDLLSSRKALAIETSRGCPFRCAYCSTGTLHPGYRRKSPARVVDEIDYAVSEFGTEDFAFYDDALLFEPESHFEPIAQELLRRGLKARFHTPNGLSAAYITPRVAELMQAMGMKTVRLSLETSDVERLRSWNRRVLPGHFMEAMRNLREAGFTRDQLGVYLLCAFPGQSVQEVKTAIDLVIEHGGTPKLGEYSPIPGTPGWQQALEATHLPLGEEPLLQNNSVYYWASGALKPEVLTELKHYMAEQTGQGGKG